MPEPAPVIPTEELRVLGGISGVRFISLQKDADISPLRDELNFLDLGANLDQAAGPFMDTAAIIQNLDLVITVDTSVGHLAGALDVRTWEALSFVSDWRWMYDRRESPWYPTMRLFRQSAVGDWVGVLRQIRTALSELVAQSVTAAPDLIASELVQVVLTEASGQGRVGSDGLNAALSGTVH